MFVIRLVDLTLVLVHASVFVRFVVLLFFVMLALSLQNDIFGGQLCLGPTCF